MRRLLLTIFCFLLLSELHANSVYNHCLFDSINIPIQQENNQIIQSVSNQALTNDNNAQSPSDVISTLTLVVNSLNNALTSTNNQVTVWSLVLSLITLIVAVIGVVGHIRLSHYVKKIEDIKKHQVLQQKKDELRDLYMERINNWMLDVNLQLAENITSNIESNSGINETYKKTYLGYYITKLCVTNVPFEKELKKQAINNIQQALNQIVEGGGTDDLIALQDMADFEINKEKKKMLKKAVKELQARLLK